ncbi:hypothetical protein CLV51_107154 [Chitinophaga niastensis]|uniref:Uncharacterized protein n=1 Tax=Chitinophaga niastensis TaxID=536980 RepID=A0A2P8HC75_CHINA|nr:hypothetical protein [Chitinophaga niastensis]PSL43843.1 hypothetical protein CLV51_107154 [Chitinophaga niastensis]
MKFELLPVIEIMLDLYKKPANIDRFTAYLKLLQGNTKGELIMPLGGFNPMGKEHVYAKLTALKELNAEQIIAATLANLNKKLISDKNETVFKVALNLSDDLKGAWTNHYTADYDNRFKLNPLVVRNFCIPVFWTSEICNENIITERTLASCYRTLYWLSHSAPATLKEHCDQEKFVAAKVNYQDKSGVNNFKKVAEYYHQHQDSKDYNIIFNFLYGDQAAEQLNFVRYGVEGEMTGLRYIAQIANS